MPALVNRNKRKTQELVEVPGQRLKRARPLAELQALKANVIAIDPCSPNLANDTFDTLGEDSVPKPLTPPTTPSAKHRKSIVRNRSAAPGTQADRLSKKWIFTLAF